MELVTQRDNRISILKLDGRFDAHGAPQVVAWYDENIKPETPNVIVNLEGVNFVDSTALATLVQGMKRTRQVQGDLKLCMLQQPVRIIFELTRLDKAFDIFATADDAARAFATTENAG